MQFELRSDIIIVLLAGTLLLIFLVGFILSFLIFYQKKKIIHKEDLALIKSKYQQEILQTQIEIQEQTLKNISQEIHDNIGQILSLAKLNVNTMEGASPKILSEKISDSKQLISKAIQDLRDLSRSLNADYIYETGLIESIQYELTLIEKSSEIKFNLFISGHVVKLEKQEELILYRIIQEALHNIIKHAKAQEVSISMDFQSQQLILKIKDNGIGFISSYNMDLKNKITGLGLKNMKNRAKMINAQFEVNSQPGLGTEILLILPINNSISY